MPTDNISNKEPKKEKNIKHGIIALTSIGIAILLIAIGIYFYGPHDVPKEDVKSIDTNHVTSPPS